MNIRIYSVVYIFTNECPTIFVHVVYSQMNIQMNSNEKYWPSIMVNEYNWIVKIKEEKDKGNSFIINRWNVKLPKLFWIPTNILCSSFIWMYLLESDIPNEYPNIFMRRKSLEWMSVYFCSKKIHEYLGEWIYLSINVQIYSNIQIFATNWNTYIFKEI